MEITFTAYDYENGTLEKPIPAIDNVPEWYKKAKSYLGDKPIPSLTGEAAATVKKCMPLFDMMTAGYLLTTHCDLFVQQINGETIYQWVGNDAVAFQPIEQTQGHPAFANEKSAARFLHPWSVKTPKGFSLLFLPPSHRETPFNVLPGIIDSDKYHAPINTFFTLKDRNFQGLIPAGTPFAQLIPIKRENWTSKLGGDKEKRVIKSHIEKRGLLFFNRYKTFWWQQKNYK